MLKSYDTTVTYHMKQKDLTKEVLKDILQERKIIRRKKQITQPMVGKADKTTSRKNHGKGVAGRGFL